MRSKDTARDQRRLSTKDGRATHARIAAVEGIYLSREWHKTFRRFDMEGLSGDERRAIIRRQFAQK